MSILNLFSKTDESSLDVYLPVSSIMKKLACEGITLTNETLSISF